MPCATTPRGFTDTKIPWSDVIQNNPCAAKALTSVGGVDVSAETRCLFHWVQKNGQGALRSPVVTEP
jgi:hypothetical protein